MATFVDVLFEAMLNEDITCPSSTGSGLLANCFVDLTHIVTWHFLEIAPRSIELLSCPDVSANLLLLLASWLSVIAF